MTSLVQKLSLLAGAGTLTSDDVLQYALYPGRLYTAKEKEELRSIVRDLQTVVPVGRSDAEEYVNNAPGGEGEWEARFAAGLNRTQPLGFARESDMNETREGPYFSLFHPLEENPALRHFAGQLNSSISLLRPTTMRNRSKPMFITPGIDKDVLGQQTSAYLQTINNQLQVINSWIGQKQSQLARLRAEGGDVRKIESLRLEITNLEAQSARLSLLLRQAYGNVNVYEGPRDAPLLGTVEAHPGGVTPNPEPSAPPLPEPGEPHFDPHFGLVEDLKEEKEPNRVRPRHSSDDENPVSQSSDESDNDEPVGLAFWDLHDPLTARQLRRADRKEDRPDVDAKSQPLGRVGLGTLVKGGVTVAGAAALAAYANPSLIAQASNAVTGSLFNPTAPNLHLPSNITTEGANNDNGGSAHPIIDLGYAAGHHAKELANILGDNALKGINYAKEAALAYVPDIKVDWARAAAAASYVPGALMNKIPDPAGLLTGMAGSVGSRGPEVYPPYFQSSWAQSQQQAYLEELAHKAGSFHTYAQLGKETFAPGSYGPTSNVSTASVENLRSQADLINFFNTSSPTYNLIGGSEQDEHMRLYLEHVNATQTKKWFEGNPDIDRGKALPWGNSTEVDAMLRTYAGSDDDKKKEAHDMLVKMWKSGGLHADAYSTISEVDGFKQAFKAAGSRGKRKRSQGGGGRAPARGRGRAPMRGRGASRVKRQKY